MSSGLAQSDQAGQDAAGSGVRGYIGQGQVAGGRVLRGCAGVVRAGPPVWWRCCKPRTLPVPGGPCIRKLRGGCRSPVKLQQAGAGSRECQVEVSHRAGSGSRPWIASAGDSPRLPPMQPQHASRLETALQARSKVHAAQHATQRQPHVHCKCPQLHMRPSHTCVARASRTVGGVLHALLPLAACLGAAPAGHTRAHSCGSLPALTHRWGILKGSSSACRTSCLTDLHAHRGARHMEAALHS